jgi:2-hydroxy-6-oxonona-2,4-dienedioate hydrolase
MSSTYWVDLLGTEVHTVVGRYRTRVLERGTGAPLLLLHGTGGHAENYARNLSRLAENFRVVALDFLWHGLSQPGDFDAEIIPPLVDQVIDVMDCLGMSRAAVEGQSLGGWVAMRLALAHPDRVERLILTTTQGYTPDEGTIPGYTEPDWSTNLASSLAVLRDPSVTNVRARMERILADPANLTDEAVQVRRALYRNPELAAVQQRFVTEYLSGTAVRRHVITDELARRITAPTLVYWGDRNRTPPALGRRLAGQVGNGRFHCAAGAGHWAQYESAAEHDRVVTKFLTTMARESDACFA